MHGRPRQPDGAAWLRCAALLLLCRAGECLLLGGAPPARAAPRTSGVSGLVCAARPITNLADVETYEAKIAEAKAGNKLVVIKFFASWCRACKAMAPKYLREAEEWPEIEFCEIMFDNNKKLCKSLGIKVLPYIEIVAGSEGKVEGFTCGPSKFPRLQERLQVHGGCGEDIPCTDVSHLLEDI